MIGKLTRIDHGLTVAIVLYLYVARAIIFTWLQVLVLASTVSTSMMIKSYNQIL